MTDEERLAYLQSLSPEMIATLKNLLAPVEDE